MGTSPKRNRVFPLKSRTPHEILQERLKTLPGAKAGKMFGHPAFYVNGRLFACLFGDALGLKIPEALASELTRRGKAQPFRPYGKSKMREWIELPVQRAVTDPQGLILAALAFVRTSAHPRGVNRH